MIDWKRYSRSIRYETPDVRLDVWPYIETYGKVWKYTVYDKVTRCYISNGNAATQDEACERALKDAKI